MQVSARQGSEECFTVVKLIKQRNALNFKTANTIHCVFILELGFSILCLWFPTKMIHLNAEYKKKQKKTKKSTITQNKTVWHFF